MVRLTLQKQRTLNIIAMVVSEPIQDNVCNYTKGPLALLYERKWGRCMDDSHLKEKCQWQCPSPIIITPFKEVMLGIPDVHVVSLKLERNLC